MTREPEPGKRRGSTGSGGGKEGGREVINRDDEYKQLKWHRGTETLGPRSCPPGLRFRKREDLQNVPTRLSEPGISRLKGWMCLLFALRSKEVFQAAIESREVAEKEQTVSGR